MLKNASLVLGSLALSLLGLSRKLGTQHRTKVCCLELMIICDLGAHVVRTSAIKVGAGFVESICFTSTVSALAAVRAFKGGRDERNEGTAPAGLFSRNVTGSVVNTSESDPLCHL